MITITGDAKEISALIAELQGQRNVEFDAEKFNEELKQRAGKIFAEEFSRRSAAKQYDEDCTYDSKKGF